MNTVPVVALGILVVLVTTALRAHPVESLAQPVSTVQAPILCFQLPVTRPAVNTRTPVRHRAPAEAPLSTLLPPRVPLHLARLPF